MPSWQKFIGIAAILLLSIWYSKNSKVEATLKPLIALSRGPMKGIAMIVGGVLKIVLSPIKYLIGLFHRTAPASNSAS